MTMIRWIPLFIILIIAAACDEEPAPTPTLVPPTQTPFIITATPLPATATPLPSPTHTVTPIPETEEPASGNNSSGGNTVSKPVSNIKPNCTPNQNWLKYTVVVGDTLGKLATQTDSSLNSLANANCLVNPNVIVVGQSLRVPKQPDKGDEPDPIIEDLITQFNTSQSSAVPGETITLSWSAEAGTTISLVNKTLNTTIIGSELAASGSLTYTVPNTVDPDKTKAITFSVNGKLIRDDEEVFANPVDRTISIESPLDDCDDSQDTDTTDDDCEVPDDQCDDSQDTDTTDDDCEVPDDQCDDSQDTDTTDDDCEVPDDQCDDSQDTDTTDDDCEVPDDQCDDSQDTDTTDDDCEVPDDQCDDSQDTDTTDDDCEVPDDDTDDSNNDDDSNDDTSDDDSDDAQD